ncbi:MAG: sulfatase-like hydrolase/transferase [Planctomycetes bacterium]|nr:sulfatase-like hydrolase/transferase [Planctomycetota bacterium]
MTTMNILWITFDSTKTTALPMFGNPYCRAPNLDRLAGEGVSFSRAFCQMPKCVPSRQSMLTGRYPHTDGLRAMGSKAGVGGVNAHMLLTAENRNILPLLKDRGYALCHKGVQHLVSWDCYERWFDSRMDWDGRFKQCKAPPQTNADPLLARALYAGPVPAEYPLECDHDFEASRQMIEFLEGWRGGRPFLAYLDLRAPHPLYRDWPVMGDYYRDLYVPRPPACPLDQAPWTEAQQRRIYDLEGMTDGQWQTIVKAYYSAITYNDMLLGRVLDSLASAGLDRDTMVIFSADHGDFAGEHGCVEKHDTILYDCHVRLPLIMRFPASSGLPAGILRDGLAEYIDIAATILDAAGISRPGWMAGRSLLPYCRDAALPARDAVFAQGGVEREALIAPDGKGPNIDVPAGRQPTIKELVALSHSDFMLKAKMVRTENHKLIYRLNGHHELYDLRADPHELRNLADDPACAQIRAELAERLVRHLIETETNEPPLASVVA